MNIPHESQWLFKKPQEPFIGPKADADTFWLNEYKKVLEQEKPKPQTNNNTQFNILNQFMPTRPSSERRQFDLDASLQYFAPQP